VAAAVVVLSRLMASGLAEAAGLRPPLKGTRMAIASKKPSKPDPNQIYVCWHPFAMGDHILVREGERLRGDHEAVCKSPGNFVLDGTPRSEWPSIWDSIQAPAEDEPWFRQPEPIPLDEAVEAMQTLWATIEGKPRHVHKGQRLRRTDPLVEKHPEFFQLPARPLVG
jgi:hypothetical protein